MKCMFPCQSIPPATVILHVGWENSFNNRGPILITQLWYKCNELLGINASFDTTHTPQSDAIKTLSTQLTP